MALWFNLRIGDVEVGSMEIRRIEQLDLSRPHIELADQICTYTVHVDGRHIGDIKHRYGNGAWKLLALAVNLHTQNQDTSA